MKKITADVLVIGAGPAGLAAAVSAREAGAEHVVLVERDRAPGGILQQCVHVGFGLDYFGEDLTGPEYAERFIRKAREADIQWFFRTTALEIREETLVCASEEGLLVIRFGALVLAMGCRERTRANLVIPGSRPAGIFTAGTAQRLINICGEKIGKEILILGSGDIGMIMARRLTLEGAHVHAVLEIQPKLTGLLRNKVQCLDDFGIPLYLSHTAARIEGRDRVEGILAAPVDEKMQPVLSRAERIPCDTLLLSVGLIPENELTRAAGIRMSAVTGGAEVNDFLQTSRPDVFSCGNVLHVLDLVDKVSREAERAGANAARYARGEALL